MMLNSAFLNQDKSWTFTWQWISRSVDLDKDWFTLQAVFHSIDADVVRLPRHEVT